MVVTRRDLIEEIYSKGLRLACIFTPQFSTMGGIEDPYLEVNGEVVKRGINLEDATFKPMFDGDDADFGDALYLKGGVDFVPIEKIIFTDEDYNSEFKKVFLSVKPFEGYYEDYMINLLELYSKDSNGVECFKINCTDLIVIDERGNQSDEYGL